MRPRLEKVSSVLDKGCTDTPGSQLPQKNAGPPPRLIRKTKEKCANHNLVVQSQPWSGPGCSYVKEKMETLEDMPGDENCIETPLSQLVQWSYLLVLRNPCIGCFA